MVFRPRRMTDNEFLLSEENIWKMDYMCLKIEQNTK